MFDGRGKYTYENGEIKERKWYFDKYIKNNLFSFKINRMEIYGI